MRFLKVLSGFVTLLFIMCQISLVVLVSWIIYFIYNNGLKALIDGIWMGFTGAPL